MGRCIICVGPKCNYMCPYKKVAEIREEEKAILPQRNRLEWRGPKPRKTSSHHKLEEASTRFVLGFLVNTDNILILAWPY